MARAIVCAAAIALLPACASITAVRPWSGMGDMGPTGLLERTALWVDGVVVPPGADIEPETIEPLADAFRSFLRTNGGWGKVLATQGEVDAYAAEHPDHTVLRVVPHLTASYTWRHTFLLDALTLMTVGYFPLSPAWGEVEVTMEVEVLDRSGRARMEPVRAHVATSHGTFIYGLFRVDEIERAYQRLYRRAFEDLSREIRTRLADGERVRRETELFADLEARARTASVAAAFARSASVASSSVALAARPPLPVATLPVARTGTVPVLAAAPWRMEAVRSPVLETFQAGGLAPAEPIFLPPEDFDILSRPFARADDGLAMRYLRALGGIEAATFRGGASVESRTATANGADELVGSGRAEATGYRFSFYRPPDRTGFFFPPTVGLLWEDITITGFRDDIPIAQTADIPAIASDPATGVPVDLTQPLSYDLKLRSGYIGQGLGLNLVAGVEDAQLFLTFQGHVNLVELRYVNVQIGKNAVEGYDFVGFRSAGVGGQLGLAFPNAHFAVRASFTAEWFFEFDYPQPVEFQAATRFNPDKQVFERERAFVKGASVETYNGQIAVSAIF